MKYLQIYFPENSLSYFESWILFRESDKEKQFLEDS